MAAKPERLAPMLDVVAKSDRRAIGDAIYEQFTTDLRPMLSAIRSPVLVVLADRTRSTSRGPGAWSSPTSRSGSRPTGFATRSRTSSGARTWTRWFAGR